MTNISNWIVLPTILLVLFGCSSNDAVVEKEHEWRTKLEQFQPIGKTRKELFDWQNKNGVQLDSFPHKKGIILESIEGDGLVCSKWNIYLAIDVDSNEKISSYSVSSAGTCL
ncbi:hypothetical protein [Microbulbifer sp. SAOS-129_SWC]|uniref:hypothetical protein n=1 Tax=Microbulbifer sp. SAOS-129_SWC TaxID=3145235 RepID=UPI0032179A7F